MSNLCHQEKSPELPAPDFSKDEAKALAMAPQKIVRIPMFDIGIYIYVISYICYIYIYVIYWAETCNILAGFCNQYVSYIFIRRISIDWGWRRLKDQAARANGSPSSFIETSSLSHGWWLPAWNSRAQLRWRQLHQHRSCDGHWPCQGTVLQLLCSRASWGFHNMFVFLAYSEPKALRV